MPDPSHAVVFFEHDEALLGAMTAFTVEGLDAGERVVVIATPQHVASLVSALGRRGAAPPAHNLLLFYAAEAIRRVAPDGAVEPQRLADWLEPIIDQGPCRVFGEMVSLLAERGRLDAAFELEAAGDELAHTRGVRVLCGYDLRHLANAPAGAVERLGASHGVVVDVPPREAAAPAGRRVRVLLAEDFQDARDIYAEYLQYADLDVVTAADGEEAVKRARERVPDVVLMDIRMPKLTGTQAMHLLREDERFRRVPFIAVTALTHEHERTALLAEGFDGVLAKPCLPDQLVAEVLQRAAQRAEPA
jgi:CheY-like chemotaxis protein